MLLEAVMLLIETVLRDPHVLGMDSLPRESKLMLGMCLTLAKEKAMNWRIKAVVLVEIFAWYVRELLALDQFNEDDFRSLPQFAVVGQYRLPFSYLGKFNTSFFMDGVDGSIA